MSTKNITAEKNKRQVGNNSLTFGKRKGKIMTSKHSSSYLSQQSFICQIKLQSMESSLSFYSTKSKNIKKMLNFQKDIIMPNIYSTQNFQFIRNNSYPLRSQAKVIAAKKAKVQQLVQTIINKKHVDVSKKTPNYRYRLSKPPPQEKRKSLPVFRLMDPDTMTMDIDEAINQRALMYQDQANTNKQKVLEMLKKVQVDQKKNQNDNQQINFYLTSVSPNKKKKSSDKKTIYIAPSKRVKSEVKGYVDEQEEKEKSRIFRNKKQILIQNQMIVKSRPKTAGSTQIRKVNNQNQKQQYSLVRSGSLLFGKLSRLETGKEVLENIRQKSKNSKEKEKMKTIFDQIQNSVFENTLSKGEIIKNMNKLAMLWKDQHQFLNNSHVIAAISNQSLSLLRSIRQKEQHMEEMDTRIIEEH